MGGGGGGGGTMSETKWPFMKEKCAIAKGIIRSHLSKKDRQHNGRKINKTLHRKLKIEQHEPH